MIFVYFSNRENDNGIPSGISEYRKEKILRARGKKEKLQMINSAIVLKAGFSDFGINESEIIYKTAENGKPYAENHPEVNFSLSHTESAAVAAFSDRKVGIDCEHSGRNISDSVIKRFFSEKEYISFSSNPLLLWVAKESLVKFTGTGFSEGVRKNIIPYFDSEIFFDGFFLKRLNINGYLTVICTDKKSEINIIYADNQKNP